MVHLRPYVFVFLICAISPCKAASLTLFVYFDSSHELSDMALKNITDMARAQTTDQITVLVQLHAYDNIALRYQVVPGAIRLVDTIVLTDDAASDIVDAAAWAYQSAPADQYMLVLWNHGFGILDPVWDPVQGTWTAEPDALYNRECNACLRTAHNQHYVRRHRGFVFSSNHTNYLRSGQIPEVLKAISDDILGGQKLAVVGFDTCMGAMLEVGYLAAPYAHYLVGSQNCEMRDGWDYAALLNRLGSGIETAGEAARAVVETFSTYYQEHTQEEVYTCAAINLSCIPILKEAVDVAVELALACWAQYGSAFKEAVIKARRVSPRFCFVPTYTDLHVFCHNLVAELADFTDSAELTTLRIALASICALVRKVTIARCQGADMEGRVNGLSIYFPLSHIDSSYVHNNFAQESAWIRFLEMVIS